MSNIHLSNAIIFEQIFKQELTLKKQGIFSYDIIKKHTFVQKVHNSRLYTWRICSKGIIEVLFLRMVAD